MADQLYSVKCNFYKKTFVNQRNGTPIFSGNKIVAAGDIGEMLDHLWRIIMESGSLEREVVVEGDTVAWSADIPDASNNEIDKFALLYDPKGRRSHAPTSISSDLLASLRNKEVHIIVFVYSRNISTFAIFSLVKKNLLDPAVKDRSAAVANQGVDEIVDRLKRTHSHQFITQQPIGWRIWATYIATKPSHSHDELILNPPPDHIVPMFRAIPINEAQILANAQQGLRVARNVNGFQRANLQGIRERVLQLQTIVESCQREITSLVTHLDYLQQQTEREDSLLSDVTTAVRPSESTFSVDVASMVVDCEDVDHME